MPNTNHLHPNWATLLFKNFTSFSGHSVLDKNFSILVYCILFVLTSKSLSAQCPDELINLNPSITFSDPALELGADIAIGEQIGEDCGLRLTDNEGGNAWAYYQVIIDLVSNSLVAGDQLDVYLEIDVQVSTAGFFINSSAGGSAIASGIYSSSGVFDETITIPSDITGIRLRFYTQYAQWDVAGSILVKNLNISKVEDNTTNVPVTGVSLNPSTMGLEIGQTQNFMESISPTNATNQSVSWSSSNASIASVNADGLVEAYTEGVATITVTTIDGGYEATSEINVSNQSTDGGGSSGNSPWSTLANNNIYFSSGNVGIGTQNIPSEFGLAIDGKVIAEEVRVELSDSNGAWPDYVFQKDYKLPSLDEIQKHINEKGHLPNIPSTKEVEENGVELGEMNRLLLEKIEELTLYILNQQKEINLLKSKD